MTSSIPCEKLEITKFLCQWKGYNETSCRKKSFDSLRFVKAEEINIQLMAPHRHKIISNKGKDCHVDTRWHTCSVQIKVSILNGIYIVTIKKISEIIIKFSRKMTVIKRELSDKKKQ